MVMGGQGLLIHMKVKAGPCSNQIEENVNAGFDTKLSEHTSL